MAKVLNNVLAIFGVIFIIIIILIIIMYYNLIKGIRDMKKGISSLIYNTIKINPKMTEKERVDMSRKIATCMVDNMVCAFGYTHAKKLYDKKEVPTEAETHRLQTIAIGCGLPTIGNLV